ncbi:hypothetical protein BpHYR1_034560 [Brachionus plicatilis]|uniref:Uncharacterized protein n=1 Tax=Brachionus plicatilis TaxID=10195 RepID=A0A3M7R0Q4_BRAPC|nr:hypothetical protein BpHYR1_034560 [Brachionus plicatilis]
MTSYNIFECCSPSKPFFTVTYGTIHKQTVNICTVCRMLINIILGYDLKIECQQINRYGVFTSKVLLDSSQKGLCKS